MGMSKEEFVRKLTADKQAAKAKRRQLTDKEYDGYTKRLSAKLSCIRLSQERGYIR